MIYSAIWAVLEQICVTFPGVQLISAETVPVRLYSGNQHGDHEQTYTWNHGDRSETWLYVVRIYIDGDFEEPPKEVLPPVPELDDDDCDCCAVSWKPIGW